jgi:DNA-binding transcriptional LysR family regulator
VVHGVDTTGGPDPQPRGIGAHALCKNPQVALDWDDLRILLALEAAGSVSGAARALEVDHSTVSRRLAAIEEALGRRLVTRASTGLVWTDAGTSAVAAARAVEAEMIALRRKLEPSVIDGLVRVSVPAGLAALVTRWLAPIGDANPALRIEVTGATATIDLRRREADLALRMAKPTQPDLIARPALTLGWAVYAAPSYLARRERPAQLGAFAGHDLVLYAPTMQHVAGAAWLEAHQGGGTVRVRAENTQAALLAIVDGLGIGVVPCFQTAGTGLERVFDDVVASHDGWVVCHEDERHTPRVRLVADALIAALDRERVLLRGEVAAPG